MENRNSIIKCLRGWFPQEVIALGPQRFDAKFQPVIRWTAMAIVAGGMVSALLLVLGDVAGFTRGVGAYFWYAGVEGTIWGVVAAVPFLVMRRKNPQWRNKE